MTVNVKSAELTGAALDWAAAKAGDETPKINCTSFQAALIYRVHLGWSYQHSSSGTIVEYTPSTNWAQGGPIIEREGCFPSRYDGAAESKGKVYQALADNGTRAYAQGPTPLIAAMRCYVASKLGEFVDIPAELIA